MKTNSQVKKAKVKKAKKISITLPQREGEVLKLYAKEFHVSCPEAVRRMVREALKQYKSVSSKAEPLNQLGLFDTVQVDIFNNIQLGLFDTVQVDIFNNTSKSID